MSYVCVYITYTYMYVHTFILATGHNQRHCEDTNLEITLSLSFSLSLFFSLYLSLSMYIYIHKYIYI